MVFRVTEILSDKDWIWLLCWQKWSLRYYGACPTKCPLLYGGKEYTILFLHCRNLFRWLTAHLWVCWMSLTAGNHVWKFERVAENYTDWGRDSNLFPSVSKVPISIKTIFSPPWTLWPWKPRSASVQRWKAPFLSWMWNGCGHFHWALEWWHKSELHSFVCWGGGTLSEWAEGACQPVTCVWGLFKTCWQFELVCVYLCLVRLSPSVTFTSILCTSLHWSCPVLLCSAKSACAVLYMAAGSKC